ncbi:F-box/FBD/LRR-repeat protein-like protein [Salvia divinorum]|uniref:F-box/FBD/LRR-repeat protein-like protein n=1 Tax=Salvia divinorum TaxID=28513 RepID=A0ABD1G9Q3_SALDI
MENGDRISELPSDILISIISRLPMREATATCILSTRWQHLHAYITHLNFPKFTYYSHIDYMNPYYAHTVNQVLNSYKGGRIKEFMLELHKCGKFNIEKWFEFALTRQAEIIHISLPGMVVHGLPNTNGLKCLKDLSLIDIQMTDQYFNFLVSNCLVLECVTIKCSDKLENVSIVGPSQLKNLNLSFLSGVRSIVIRDAISLVSLTCCEWRSGCSVQLSNIPKLTKLDLRDCRHNLTQVEFLAQMPSCIRDQLQLLRLSSDSFPSFPMYKYNLELLDDLSFQFANMKHLELVLAMAIDPECYYVPRYACRLAETCDSLEKLVIRFLPWVMMDMGEFECNAEPYNHPRCDLSQKYLEILGYSGSSSERELAVYVINNATSLQKLILDGTCLKRPKRKRKSINL